MRRLCGAQQSIIHRLRTGASQRRLNVAADRCCHDQFIAFPHSARGQRRRRGVCRRPRSVRSAGRTFQRRCHLGEHVDQWVHDHHADSQRERNSVGYRLNLIEHERERDHDGAVDQRRHARRYQSTEQRRE